jgi:hypothetical protein
LWWPPPSASSASSTYPFASPSTSLHNRQDQKKYNPKKSLHMNFWRWSSFGDSRKFFWHIFRYAKQRSSEADLGRKQGLST